MEAFNDRPKDAVNDSKRTEPGSHGESDQPGDEQFDLRPLATHTKNKPLAALRTLAPNQCPQVIPAARTVSVVFRKKNPQ